MSEMVERVARAIAAAEGYDIDGLRAYVESSSVSKKDYERLMAKARAAIEAMRAPTAEMEDAGNQALTKNGLDRVWGDDSTSAWQSMINAALE